MNKSIPDSVVLFRLGGMLVACWAVPLLLCHYVGPVAGALGAVGAAALWYSQYRFPAWRERSGYPFWFAASGYVVITVLLLVCLGRLLR
jgi:hypothetical protein